jgi:hypothetical protein
MFIKTARGVEYAKGGPPITTKSRFLKTPDVFRSKVEVQKTDYGAKTDPLAKKVGETKVEKPIKPRT